LKIYRVWSDSMHKVQYTYGYFLKKEDAQKVYGRIEQTAAGPQAGIEEIDVIDSCDDGELCSCSCHKYYKFHRTCCDRR